MEPQGAIGATGATGDAGTNATVTNVETANAVEFNFTIPRGDVWLLALKLEIGTISTPHSQAPEDILN
ncbi:hypothetical protein [Lactiplantibacillus pentosus]|uniref:hypothetical protein n=1 Tax=Lactiplantibacillus pentosus TaxID=1589 RepID=UPI001CFFCF0B|nr:hypothetical protein [Lactiplantibacillus pentosus]MCB5223054.1 hypothetical protein [Lactiplantibacillus pentosus]